MKTSLSIQMTRAALLGAALLLGACMTNEEAGGETATGEVNAQTAGASLVGSFQQAGDWNAATAAPSARSLNSFSTKMSATLQKKTAMPKLSAAADLGVEEKVLLDDTGKGFFTYIKVANGLFETTSDTAVGRWDEKSKDSVKDNETILSLHHVVVHKIGGKVETVDFADADGDGIVSIVPGGDNKARLTFTSTENGVTETAILVAGAGPDDDWDNENDNLLYSANWSRTKAGVKIAEGSFEDGDNDGLLGDNSKDCIVKAHFWELEPKDKPLVAKSDARMTVRVFARKAGSSSSRGDEPVTLAFTETMKSGRVNAVTVKNRQGGEEIIKNDTLWVKLETTVSTGDDTLKHAEIIFVMNPGSDLKNDSDDVLYAIHIKTQKQHGFERTAEFNFVSDAPVPHGQQPAAGRFDGQVTYANGKSASLEGSFSPAGFSAKYTGPEGNTVSVDFTKGGQVVGGV